MKVKVAETAGFCFGVKRAVNKVYELIDTEQKPIFTLGPIIHNEGVVADLEARGVHVITEADLDFPDDTLQNGTVVIRSHGVGKAIYDKLKEKNISYVDVTCPFVLKIHRIVEKESLAGNHIIIIGDKDHPEVQGICGWCQGPYTVISKIPAKKRLADFPNYLIHRAEQLENLYIFTNTEGTPENIRKFHPNLIVSSTGSAPLLPPIRGLHDRIDKEGSKVASILGMINHINDYPEDMTSKKVVVVGGGAVGLDVVEFFAARNAEISIVEMMDQIGRDLDPVTKNDMKDQMKKHHVAQLTKTALQEVKDSSFLVKDAEGERELPFDYGFVCLGMRAQGQLFAELSDAFVSDDVEILNIGDSKRARRIIDGTLEGRNILNTLTQMGYLQ